MKLLMHHEALLNHLWVKSQMHSAGSNQSIQVGTRQEVDYLIYLPRVEDKRLGPVHSDQFCLQPDLLQVHTAVKCSKTCILVLKTCISPLRAVGSTVDHAHGPTLLTNRCSRWCEEPISYQQTFTVPLAVLTTRHLRNLVLSSPLRARTLCQLMQVWISLAQSVWLIKTVARDLTQGKGNSSFRWALVINLGKPVGTINLYLYFRMQWPYPNNKRLLTITTRAQILATTSMHQTQHSLVQTLELAPSSPTSEVPVASHLVGLIAKQVLIKIRNSALVHVAQSSNARRQT